MGKRDWWRRSLNRHFRLLEGKSLALEQRRRIEGKGTRAQRKQTLEQQEKTFERPCEAITCMDTLERKKIAKELTWKAKWSTRKTKFNVWARKHR